MTGSDTGVCAWYASQLLISLFLILNDVIVLLVTINLIHWLTLEMVASSSCRASVAAMSITSYTQLCGLCYS